MAAKLRGRDAENHRLQSTKDTTKHIVTSWFPGFLKTNALILFTHPTFTSKSIKEDTTCDL